MVDVAVEIVPPPALVVSIGDVSSVSLLYTGKFAYSLTAGVTFAYGEIGYIHTDGTVLKAQSDGTEIEARATVICVQAGGVLSAAVGLFSTQGFIAGLSGGTAGALAYASATAGAIDASQPAQPFPKPVGRWLSATLLYFAPISEVSRPASTDNAMMRYDGTGGVPQNSTVIVTDAGAVSGITSLVMGGALSGVTTLAMGGAITGAAAIGASGDLTITKATPRIFLVGTEGSARSARIYEDAGTLFFRDDSGFGTLMSLAMASGNAAITGAATILSSTASSSPTTGSLINGGGFGNAGRAYFGDYVSVNYAAGGGISFDVINTSANQYGYMRVIGDGNGGGQIGFLAGATVRGGIYADINGVTLHHGTATTFLSSTATVVTIPLALNVTGLITAPTGIAFANETLANYDEGVFTPTFVGDGGTPGVFTYTVQTGRYCRIGRSVYFSLEIAISNIGTPPTGNLTLAGLPFAVAAAASSGIAIGYISNFTQTVLKTGWGTYAEKSGSVIYVIETQSGAAFAFSQAATVLLNTSRILISGNYEV